jgi:hypothetical protein
MKFAQESANDDRPYKVCLYLQDARAAHVRRLHTLSAAAPDVECHISRGDFWSRSDNVIQLVGSDPVFLFVDPFGLSHLDFDALVRMTRRIQRLDLMVNLATPAAGRLKSRLPHVVTRAVGSEDWEQGTVREVFCRNLQTRGNFLSPAVLPVTVKGRVKYELVMAARHPAAYALWNDEIAAADREMKGDALETRIRESLTILRAAVAGRRSWDRERLWKQLVVRDCGEMHRSVYLAAVDHLLGTGEWQRGPGGIASAPLSHGLITRERAPRPTE